MWLPLFSSPAVFLPHPAWWQRADFWLVGVLFPEPVRRRALRSVFSVRCWFYRNIGKRSRGELVTLSALVARRQTEGSILVLRCLDVLPSSSEAEEEKSRRTWQRCAPMQSACDCWGFGTILVYVLLGVCGWGPDHLHVTHRELHTHHSMTAEFSHLGQLWRLFISQIETRLVRCGALNFTIWIETVSLFCQLFFFP